MTAKILLDTDNLSAVMRGDPVAVARARKYLKEHNRFSFSRITRYEILRGLKAKQAVTQITAFERLCQACEIISISDQVIVRASDLYADLHRKGQLTADADLIIAATAIEHDFVLATNNVRHFDRIAGLKRDNWLKSETVNGE